MKNRKFPNDPKTCICGKLRYESRSEAETALDAVRRKRKRQRSEKSESVIYNCRIAGYYHLSSRDDKMDRMKPLTTIIGTDIYFIHFYCRKRNLSIYGF